MSNTMTRPAEGYQRPAWNVAVSQALPAALQRESTPRWVQRVPLITLLVVLGALTLRLSNTAFIDEALSISIGHDYLGYWLTGNGIGVYGSSYAGLPLGYPVLAAALDTIGGLQLVRGFSLLCVLAATVFVHDGLSRSGRRSEGIFTAAIFAFTGPVMVVGGLATFDALVIAMLAAAFWLSVRRSQESAIAAGVLLGLVPVVKYSAIAFLPVMLGVVVLTSPRARALAVGTAAVAVTGFAWLLWSDEIAEAIALNTVGRAGSGAHLAGDLVAWLTLDIGMILVVALAGALLLVRDGGRPTALALLLLVGGLALPVGQLILGQDASFEKNLAFSALFLAPLAGHALARLSRRTWKLLPTTVLLLVVLLFGFSRSDAIYGSWVSVQPVIDVVEDDPRPGTYISSVTESLNYHLGDHPDIQGVDFSSYSQEEDLVRVAVEDQLFERAVLRTSSTGSAELDEVQSELLQALRDSPNYRLTASMPARDDSDTDTWLVFTRTAP